MNVKGKKEYMPYSFEPKVRVEGADPYAVNTVFG